MLASALNEAIPLLEFMIESMLFNSKDTLKAVDGLNLEVVGLIY